MTFSAAVPTVWLMLLQYLEQILAKQVAAPQEGRVIGGPPARAA